MSRERWSSKLIFIFAAIGSAVGLGAVWRFPYLVGKYGGGAFLVPYFIILLVMGIPLLIMEFALGQKMQLGAVGAFGKINKKFRGIGLASILCGFAVTAYYTVVMAWGLLYTLFSFTMKWGEDTKGFFLNDVLQLSPDIGTMGYIIPSILISLVICWIFIYFSVWKGVKSVGKVVSITMPLPVIILLILCIRGVFLPGAGEGLLFYLKPNFTALLDREVWIAAMSQIFFTLTLGFGVMIAYASFQDKRSDITKSAFITAIVNVAISLVAGFAVFSTLGYMALQQNVPVSELASSGPSLAFIVFPQALSLIPGATFFAVLFFIMVLTLAIDSAFSLVEAIAVVVTDSYPRLRREQVILYICVVGFIGGIIFTTSAGLYYLDIVDHFITNYGLVLVSLFQCVTAGWIYGAGKLRTYINDVSDFALGKWWEIAIKYVIPVILVLLILTALSSDLVRAYENYPSWALDVAGWGILGLIATVSFFFSVLANGNNQNKEIKETKGAKPL